MSEQTKTPNEVVDPKADPGSNWIKRVVLKMRPDKTIHVKLDTADGVDTINPVELNLFIRHLQVEFRGYLGNAYRASVEKQKQKAAILALDLAKTGQVVVAKAPTA